jgi:large subunit ribosomal protein L29
MMAKKTDYRSMSTDELHKELDDARQELMNLRFQVSTGELTDYTRLRHTRRLIARMLTALSEHERLAK